MSDTSRPSNLEHARAAADVLSLLAQAAWRKQFEGADCPADQIPSVASLGEWLERCPVATWRQTWALAQPLMPDAKVGYLGPGMLMPAWAAANGYGCIFWIGRTTDPHDPDRASVTVKWPTAEARSAAVAEDIESIHSAWRNDSDRGKHPLGPLVKAWQARPRLVDPDQRVTGIVPQQVQGVRSTRSVTTGRTEHNADTGALFGSEDGLGSDGSLGWRPDGQGYLPTMEPEPSALVPSLPLVLYDGSGGASLAKGQGAPLALRLFVEAVLAVPLQCRDWRTRVPIPLPDLIRFLWPNGWHSLRRDGPKLARALRQIDQARLPWEGGYWRPVSVTNMPRSRKDAVVFDIELPPGSGRGPLVFKPLLRQLGVQSAPEYRAYLGLAALRNRYMTHSGKLLALTVPEVRRNESGILLDASGSMLTGKGGVPVRHWADPRAVRTGKRLRSPECDRMPWLWDDDLIALCYPDMPDRTEHRRKYVQRSKKALLKMAANGHVLIEREYPEAPTERTKGRWRVLLADAPGKGRA